MKRHATQKDMLNILRNHSVEFGNQLSVLPLQMSFPTDGKGARIKVSIQRGQKRKLPNWIEFILDGERLEVPLEVDEDHQDYQLLKR
jgi:hypothetical protein